jgi:hypothetical protein
MIFIYLKGIISDYIQRNAVCFIMDKKFPIRISSRIKKKIDDYWNKNQKPFKCIIICIICIMRMSHKK